MELWKYSGKNVRVTFKDGTVMAGKAYDFMPSQDNPSGVASISIDIYEIYENEIKSMLEFPTDIDILKSGCTLNKLYENLFIEIKVKYDFDLRKFVYYLPSWLVDKDNLNQMHFNLYELKIADESNVGVIKKKNQTNEEDTEENITRTV